MENEAEKEGEGRAAAVGGANDALGRGSQEGRKVEMRELLSLSAGGVMVAL